MALINLFNLGYICGESFIHNITRSMLIQKFYLSYGKLCIVHFNSSTEFNIYRKLYNIL